MNEFGHDVAKDLMKQFRVDLKSLDKNKLFQISMGGRNVNLKFLETVKNEKVYNEKH